MSTNNTEAAAAPGSAPYPSTATAWYCTVLLGLLYWLSILDRTIISLMVDPIKNDIGISDVQFGMLHGMAFAVTFSLFGLVAGMLADRSSRRVIVFVSVAVWSIATAACGLAREFWHLLLARVGVGAGEAGLNPCATSMITDMFPPARLTLALAVYALGASAGSGCAYLFGGVLVETISKADTFLLPLVGAVRPWQAVFFIIGLPGIALALLSFTMQEPARRGVLRQPSQPVSSSLLGNYQELWRFMRSRGRFFCAALFGIWPGFHGYRWRHCLVPRPHGARIRVERQYDRPGAGPVVDHRRRGRQADGGQDRELPVRARLQGCAISLLLSGASNGYSRWDHRHDQLQPLGVSRRFYPVPDPDHAPERGLRRVPEPGHAQRTARRRRSFLFPPPSVCCP